MLDKVKATHGHEPVDTSAGRLLKRPRPGFLSFEGDADTTVRFQARPAARAAGSGSGAAAAAVAAAAAAAAASGAGSARKRPRDGKGLAFGAGLMSRGGASSKGLPTTLAAMMDLASKDPARFNKVRARDGVSQVDRGEVRVP